MPLIAHRIRVLFTCDRELRRLRAHVMATGIIARERADVLDERLTHLEHELEDLRTVFTPPATDPAEA